MIRFYSALLAVIALLASGCQSLFKDSESRETVQREWKPQPEEMPAPKSATKESPPAARSPEQSVRERLDALVTDFGQDADRPLQSPLGLPQVTQSVVEKFPLIQSVVEEAQVAAGKQQAARGAFDVKLVAESLNMPQGYYKNYRHLVKAEQPTWMGGGVYGQYRIGDGFFQPWYGERETNEGGEFKLGFVAPLLRGRNIDERRAEIARADLAAAAVDPQIQRQLLESVQLSSYVYWSWVAAGQAYLVTQDLLRVAEERDRAIRRQVELGNLGQTEQQQNERLIASRQAKLVESRRKLESAAIKLSLFLRDDAGDPIIPGPSDLPTGFPEPTDPASFDLNADIGVSLAQRPELRELSVARQVVNVDLQVSENELLPNLSAVMEASKDVGGPASPKRDKTPFELEAGLLFDVPVQRNKAAGKIQSARGKLTQIALKQQFTTNKIVTEVQDAYSALAAGRNLVTYFSGFGTDGSAVTRSGNAPTGSLLVAGDNAANTINVQASGTATRIDPVGYTPLDFAGNSFGTLSVDGGALADVLNLASLGSSQTNPLTSNLIGGADADTLRVQSTSGNTGVVTLAGNAGNDLFQLFNATNTVDGIAGQVIVDGSDGNVAANTDTLVVIDTGDTTADAVLLAAVNPASSPDYKLDGVTGAGVLIDDVILRNIDVLNYTGTTGDDNIDAQLVNTVPTHDLTSVTLNGWVGADKFLLFTSDQFGGSGLNNTPTGVPSGVANISLNGDAPGNSNGVDGNDVFGATPPGLTGTGSGNIGLSVPDTVRAIRPSASTGIDINGGQPTGPLPPTGDTIGDTLNLDISGLPANSSLILPTASGVVAANGLAPINYAQIEDINLFLNHQLINVQMGDTLVRGTDDADTIIFTRDASQGVNGARIRVNTDIVDVVLSGKTLTFAGAGGDFIQQANVPRPAEIYGEAGDDYISGGTNNDFLVGGLNNDQINAGGGDNVVWGDDSPTTAVPNPQILAVGGDDILSALGGNDVFYGGGGNDQISAGAGNDYASGGQGNDALGGADGDDRLYGGDGDDVLGGGAGNDLLSGGNSGNGATVGARDTLVGNTGNDVLIGGLGVDDLDGGVGADLIISGSVANKSSTGTSVASTTNYGSATYADAADNDAALLSLLTQWSSANNRSSLAAITHDGVDDDLWGGTDDDDFCWEAADVADEFPKLTPPDYNSFGMGSDERFGPT